MENKYTNPLYSIEKMQDELLEIMSVNHLTQAAGAFDFAKQAHEGQTRKEGLPYIIHPMTLVYSAAKQGILNDEILAVMFLHDVCEDCGVAVEELPFSRTIQDAVMSVTFEKGDNETKAEAKKRYYEKVRKNRIGKIVKIFDRCHNISAMGEVFSREKIKSYVEETQKYIMPMIESSMADYPEYRQILFGIEYHMKSVLYMAEAMLNKDR